MIGKTDLVFEASYTNQYSRHMPFQCKLFLEQDILFQRMKNVSLWPFTLQKISENKYFRLQRFRILKFLDVSKY